QSAPAPATPGKALTMVLVPKFLGEHAPADKISRLFDQAHEGAEQAARDLRNPTSLQFPGWNGATQLESVTRAAAHGVDAIMISNNSGDAIVPAIKAAHDKGIKVVGWDTPIPATDAVDVHVWQVDFSTSGRVLADMALDTLGPNGGKFAVLVNA